MDPSSADLSESLLRELECPVCVEYMVPPITMCQNGHIICATCRPKLQNCPTCRESFVKTRNLALESLAFQMNFPCSYRNNGCSQKNSIQNVQEHRSVCAYCPVTCPDSIVKGIMCSWNGTRGALKDHFIADHKSTACIYIGKDEITIKQFSPKVKYMKVIFAYEEVFYRRVEVIDGIWHCTLFYVGLKQDSSKFKYVISFRDENDESIVHFMHTTCCLGEDTDQVYYSCKCVKLPFDVIKRFIDEEGTLHYTMEIIQKNSPEKTTMQA